MKSSKASMWGFSLTELLVVIAIIGVLAGLLFPALAQSRFRARVAGCTSNFKQLGLASHLYANDAKGLFPAFMLPTATSKLTNYNSLEPWFVALGMLPSMESYGVQGKMWFCPMHDNWSDARRFYRAKSGGKELSSAADLVGYYRYQGAPMAFLDMFWWVPRPLEGFGKTKFPDPTLTKCRSPEPWPEKAEDPSASIKPIASDWLSAAWESDTQQARGLTGAHTLNGSIRNDNLLFGDGHVETRPMSKVQWQVISARGNFAYFY